MARVYNKPPVMVQKTFTREKTLNGKQAAEYIGVSYATLWNYVNEGLIKAEYRPTKIKSVKRVYVKSELDRFLKPLSISDLC